MYNALSLAKQAVPTTFAETQFAPLATFQRLIEQRPNIAKWLSGATSVAAAPKADAGAAAPQGPVDWSGLLAEAGLSGEPITLDCSLAVLAAANVEGRTAVLSALKAHGVAKLGDRQKLAGAISKAIRAGRELVDAKTATSGSGADGAVEGVQASTEALAAVDIGDEADASTPPPLPSEPLTLYYWPSHGRGEMVRGNAFPVNHPLRLPFARLPSCRSHAPSIVFARGAAVGCACAGAVRGCCAQVRLLLSEAGLAWTQPSWAPVEDEEKKLAYFAECRKLGGHLTTNLPLLHMDGRYVTQTASLLRYIGRRIGLYPCRVETPADILACHRIDQLIAAADDLRDLNYSAAAGISITRLMYSKTHVHPHLANFARLLGDGPYFSGTDAPTVADFTVYDVLVVAEKQVPGLLGGYPTLRQFRDRVATRPAVAKWNASEMKAQQQAEQQPVVNPDGSAVKPEWEPSM